MLELIRKYSKSIVVKIFLTILAGSFFLFFGFHFVVDKLTGRDYVVKISNKKMSPQIFKYERDKKLNAIKRRLGDVDTKEISSKVLHQIIWENVINLAADDFGIIISDPTMYSYISNMDEFRTKDGRFNAGDFRRFLRMIEVSESEFLDFSKREIKSRIIQFPFRYVSLMDEFSYYSKIRSEKRSLKFFEIDPKSFRVSEIPSAEELEEFYNDNSEKFEVPERRSFDILILSMDRIGRNVEIPQEDVIERARDLYGDDYTDQSLEKFMETEEFKSFKQEKVSEAAEEIIRQVQDDLVSGSTIDEVVKKYGLNHFNLQDVAFDEFDKIALPFSKDVMTVAFGSDEKEVGDFNEAEDSSKKLVQWLVYVSDIKPRHVEPIDRAKDEVRLAWYKDQQHSKALSVADEIISKVAAGENFSDLAKKAGYTMRSTAYFNREGKTVDERDKSEIIGALCEESFDGIKNESAMKEINGKIVVYQLNEMMYDGESEENNKSEYYVELIKDISDDMYQQLIGYLSRRYEVKINYDVLRKVDETIDSSTLDEMF